VEPADLALRVIVEAPTGSDFVLGDVKIGGNKIQFGAQIADKILIQLRGIERPAESSAPSIGCVGGAQRIDNSRSNARIINLPSVSSPKSDILYFGAVYTRHATSLRGRVVALSS
jgi:hypothetical protein